MFAEELANAVNPCAADPCEVNGFTFEKGPRYQINKQNYHNTTTRSQDLFPISRRLTLCSFTHS